MKIKKSRLIAAKITPELFKKIEEICNKIPGMYLSAYIELAIENQIEKDLNE
jgi:hypothetical protein